MKYGLLSDDCPNDFGSKAEGGFVCGFNKGLQGCLNILMTFHIPEIKHLPHFDLKGAGEHAHIHAVR